MSDTSSHAIILMRGPGPSRARVGVFSGGRIFPLLPSRILQKAQEENVPYTLLLSLKCKRRQVASSPGGSAGRSGAGGWQDAGRQAAAPVFEERREPSEFRATLACRHWARLLFQPLNYFLELGLLVPTLHMKKPRP